jgi:hypothetical protein
MSAVLKEPASAPDDKDEKEPLSAAERLAESRERLRLYMVGGDGRHEARRRMAAANADGSRGSALDRLRSLPGVGVVIDTLMGWWSRHPLHPAASLATDMARDKLVPMARRHPLAVVAGAFAVGVTIVWLRPWRFVAKSATVSGLVSQFATRSVSNIPWELVIAGLTAFAHTSSHDDESPQASPESDDIEAIYEPTPPPLSPETVLDERERVPS